MRNSNTTTKALKLYFDGKMKREEVYNAETAKAYVHKWIDGVEKDSTKLAIKFLASELRKTIDEEVDYNELWK